MKAKSTSVPSYITVKIKLDYAEEAKAVSTSKDNTSKFGNV